MRIWSLHPRYLDAKGLVALWRETLLAKKVLKGSTNGYKNHPQLIRFRKSSSPLDCINQYLSAVYQESLAREYSFDKSKINWKFASFVITVTKGQMIYEFTHLLNKLKIRDPKRFHKLSGKLEIDPHPLFSVIDGDVEEWEILENKK